MATNVTVREIGGKEMLGDSAAPVGSVYWCIWAKNEIESCIKDVTHERETITQLIDTFRKEEGWKKLKNRSGNVFSSYEEFCTTTPPFGLGVPPSTIDAIIVERKENTRKERAKKRAEEEKEPLKEQGRPSKEEKVINSENITFSDRGTSAAYRIKQLRRDAPEYAERLEKGEFKSVAAAVRASKGLDPNPPRKRPTPLEQIRRLWSKLSEEDRKTFLGEVSNLSTT